MRSLPLVTVLVLWIPSGTASDVSEEVEIQAGSTQSASITATDDAVRIEYHFPVSVDDAGAILRPLPTPWNPAYLNGTPGQDGWWTEVLVEGPDGLVSLGTTVGQESIAIDARWLNGTADVTQGGDEFPTPDAGLDLDESVNASAGPVSLNLVLVVHAPAGALGEAGSQRLNYELARPDDALSAGSGGSLQESRPVILTLDVLTEGDPETVKDDSFAPPAPICVPDCEKAHWQGLAAVSILGLAASFGAGHLLSRFRVPREPPAGALPGPRLSGRIALLPRSRRSPVDAAPSQTRLWRF